MYGFATGFYFQRKVKVNSASFRERNFFVFYGNVLAASIGVT